MVSYSLKVHSYDVYKYGKVIGRHTGYNLVTIDDNGNATIQAINLSQGNDENIDISITNSPAELITLVNKDDTTKTQSAYWEASANPEVMEMLNVYMSSELATGQSAQDAFNKIKLNAVLTNIANQISYDIIGDDWRVCNTATSYWGQQYVPGFSSNIFDSLPQGMWGYAGKDDDYVNASGYKQAEKIKAIEKLVDILLRFGNIEDILTNDEPYLSEKYLSILEPYLQQEVFSSSDEPSLIEIVRSISLEIISLPMMNFINFIPTVIKNITKTITTAEAQVSPLVIDLDGDGIETTSVANGVYFDHDGNGFSEKSAWAGKDDGLLVRDLNGNGQIDDGSELFGDNTILSNGEKAANGFEALKDLDSNNDGVFNSSDTAWSEVKVWKDGNGNGIVDDGELLTLEQANVGRYIIPFLSSSGLTRGSRLMI